MADDLTGVVRAVESRRRERRLERAQEAVALLEADGTDPVGRGALGEAVESLGDELPDWLVEARERHLTPVPPQLPVRTERLLLREPRMGDVDAMHAWYGRDDVARHLLTPALSRDEMLVELQRRTGAGPDGPRRDILSLTVELDGKPDGRVVGDLVLFLKGPSYSHGEIGWTLDPDFGGRGIATEAARGLLGIAFDHYGMHRVHAELDARNLASEALCVRLGMRRETHGLRDYWSKGEWTDSLRYALLREEYDALG